MLFSPGPTDIEEDIREIGASPLPYFRADEYLSTILALTEDLKYLLDTSQTPIILTASGSGVMEMAIQNLTQAGDSALVINGGTFGRKWVEMCRAFGLTVTEFQVEWGKDPDLDALESALRMGVKHVFATAHETSTGYLYDIQAISALAKSHGSNVIVDAISSVGADEFHMDAWHCDCVVVSSQKALACMPGVSFIALSPQAQRLARQSTRHKYYFDYQEYEGNAVRGMIPYTPGITATLQLRERLRRIRAAGLASYIKGHKDKALAFREAILNLGEYSLFPERSSNSMSAIKLPQGIKMSTIADQIYMRFGWHIAPNPTRDESYVRVSHMGDLSIENLQLMAKRINEVCSD
jgi:aspartate aminotransferase-like enzyme